jgi:predicted metalloprotease with PDZ domain
MTTPLRYELAVDDVNAHLLAVQLTLPAAPEDADHLEALLPAWTPGSYLLREYARFIQQVEARDAQGNPLEVRKVEKARWRIALPPEARGQAVTLRYRVYGYDLSVRAVHVDAGHAFINSPAALMMLEGYHDHPCTLDVRAHDPAWSIFTSLERTDGHGTPQGQATFRADDYTQLIDRPLELGPHQEHTFEAAGVTHRLVMEAPHAAPIPRLLEDLTRIVEAAAALFGGLPYTTYLFLVLAGDGAIRGGLEHLDSTVLMFPRRGYHTAKGYEDFLALAAHEHFHVWNVKRIRPHVLGPFDYTREAYTRALWLMEGATCYYENRILLRAGLLTPARYLELLLERHNALMNIPGRKLQSLEESSFDAWIKLYRPDPANVNTTVSYYLKGEVAACVLDLAIRQRSQGARSLDDVMLALWSDFREHGAGFDEDRLQARIEAAVQLDLDDLFAAVIRGTQELPLPELLDAFAIDLTPRETTGKPWLGIKPGTSDGLISADQIFSGSPAEAAGVCPGDLLLAIDHERVIQSNLADLLDSLPRNQSVPLHVFRRGVLIQLSLPVEAAPAIWQITERPEADPEAIARRDAWLLRTPPAP